MAEGSEAASGRGYGAEVMDLLIRYDSEHPATLGEMADRRALYARRITESVIRDAAEMVAQTHAETMTQAMVEAEVCGYQNGVRRGLEVAQRITGWDLSDAIAAAAVNP